MADDQNVMTLIPAPDEPPSVRREIPLNGRHHAGVVSPLTSAFRGIGMGIERKGVGGVFAGPLPELVSLLAAPALTAAAGIAIGWLQGRSGRKVRLKVGNTEAEAQTVAELKEMLALAQTMKKQSSGEEP